MIVDAGPPAIVVDARSSQLRRQVGPTAWMVLEEMLLLSHMSASGSARIACVSTRGLASSLGLAKDTVARAIRQLRDTGLVSAEQRRTDRGVFESGSYWIVVPEGITSATAATTALAVATTRPPRARVTQHDSTQLSFAIES